MKKFTRILAVVMTLAILLSGCGNQPAEGTPAPDESAATSAAPVSKTSVSLGTAGSTGAFYIIGAAMADEVNSKSDSLNILVQATKGGAENMVMIDTGDLDFGFATSGGIYANYYGADYIAEEDQLTNMSSVMALHYSYGQMLARKDSGINSFADLRGKKVCVGTTSPQVYEMSYAIMRAYGVDPETDITPLFLSQDEGIQKLSDGDIDATFLMAGIPTSACTNLLSDGKYTIVNSDYDMIKHIGVDELVWDEVGIIPAGTYPNVDEDIYSIKSSAQIVCRSDLPEDVVYEFTKLVYENFATIQRGHSALDEVNRDNFFNTSCPLHPGAEKFYKEIGLI